MSRAIRQKSMVPALFAFLSLASALTAAPTLSPQELGWAKAHPTVRIQMCRDCPPFEYRENGRDQGLAHDLLVAACTRVGLAVEVSDAGWTQSLDGMRSGKPVVDVLLAVSPSHERAAYLNFTRPYVTFPQVIFTTKDHSFISGLADLKDKTVAVEHDYLMEGWLLRDLTKSQVKVLSTTDEALRALSQGQVDAYVGNLATASHLIERMGLANLKVAAPSPYEDESFCLGVRKDQPLLLSLLQKGLDDLSPAEIRDIRQRYLSVRYEYGLSPWDVLKWMLALGSIAGLFIFALRRQVAARTRELVVEAERRASAEERVRRSERVEALGTLAAGIAHDFNNILAGIRGHTDLALAQAKGAETLEGDLRSIQSGVQRASELVRQIQSFSRQLPPGAQAVRLDQVAAEALTLLRASLPAAIEIRPELSAQGRVLATASDLHRIIVNLCVNAAAAIEDRQGLLRVEVADQVVTEPLAAVDPPLKAGRYVRLSVSDNGRGMTPEVQARIFDPFFTTSTKGTGLGLAVVHGLARACGASIGVQSRPGSGTRFDLYFPATDAPDAAPLQPTPAAKATARRILFVDDEPEVTGSAVRLLQLSGHLANGFTDPLKAWQRFESAPDDFDAIILDSSMPGLSGAELAAKIRQLRPRIPIILCSGYHDGPLDAALFNATFDKPASITELAEAVQRLT